MKWFRFYHDAIDDPKVQRLPGESFKFWVNVLCLASQSDDRGLIKLGIGEISFATRVSDDDAETMMTDLIKRGLIEETVEGYAIHNWNGRQFKSDNVAERVGKFRSKEKSPDETLHETLQATTDATLEPSVNTDSQITDTESEEELPPTPTEDDADDVKPTPKSSKPMPRNGAAQTLLAVLHEDVLQIGPPTNFGRAIADAERLAKAGCTPDELRQIAEWLLADPFWGPKGVTINRVLTQRDNWLASRSAKPVHAPRNFRGKDIGLGDDELEAIARGVA